MDITINNKDITLKNTFRSMIMYENIMDESFVPKGITEVLVYFYCVILASEKDLEIEYDDYLDWIDENPNVIKDFSEWLTKTNKIQDHIKKN